MKTLEQKYAEFEHLVDEEKLWEDGNIGFDEICRRVGIAPLEMNELLMERLGLSGYELIERFRAQKLFGDRGEIY